MQVLRFIAANRQRMYRGKEHTIKALANLAKDTISIEDEIAWDTTKPNGTPANLSTQANCTASAGTTR